MNCLAALSGHAANARCSTVAPRRREGGICTTDTPTCSQIRAHAHTAEDFFACAAPETVLALHFRPQRKKTLTPLHDASTMSMSLSLNTTSIDEASFELQLLTLAPKLLPSRLPFDMPAIGSMLSPLLLWAFTSKTESSITAYSIGWDSKCLGRVSSAPCDWLTLGRQWQ